MIIRNGPQRFEKKARKLRNKRTTGDHSNYSIINIGQNTEKSPGETCYHSDSSKRPPANAGEKNSQGINK